LFSFALAMFHDMKRISVISYILWLSIK